MLVSNQTELDAAIVAQEEEITLGPGVYALESLPTWSCRLEQQAGSFLDVAGELSDCELAKVVMLLNGYEEDN